jgi:peroxiredoxin
MKAIIAGLTIAAFCAMMASLPATAAAPKPQAKPAKGKLAQLPIGEKVPDFSLTGIDGKTYKLSTITGSGKVVVIEWFNPMCPVVHKYRKGNEFMNDTAAGLDPKKAVWLCINSGAPGKEGAGLDASKQGATDMDMKVPILLDEDGKVGKAWGAVCTPQMFVIDKDMKLQYHGAPDESTAMDKTTKGTNYIAEAVKAVLAGKKPAVQETKPFGCSVKYAN